MFIGKLNNSSDYKVIMGYKVIIGVLRGYEEWEDLREILTKKGFDLSQTALVSFIEDDEENEYGDI